MCFVYGFVFQDKKYILSTFSWRKRIHIWCLPGLQTCSKKSAGWFKTTPTNTFTSPPHTVQQVYYISHQKTKALSYGTSLWLCYRREVLCYGSNVCVRRQVDVTRWLRGIDSKRRMVTDRVTTLTGIWENGNVRGGEEDGSSAVEHPPRGLRPHGSAPPLVRSNLWHLVGSRAMTPDSH